MSLSTILEALDSEDIVPYFQPIIDLETGVVIGCEALARWIGPDRECIMPRDFIPLVEAEDLNGRLFQSLLRQTARDLGQEIAARQPFYVSFNITLHELDRPDFHASLLDLVARHGLKPDRLCLEISDREDVSCRSNAVKTVEHLFLSGFRIAIDDAGPGQNGFRSIRLLRATDLKIDRSVTSRIADDWLARSMVDVLVSIARWRGMKVTAEGVEHKVQLEALRAARVDSVQGYHHSEPVPAGRFRTMLDAAS